MKSTKKRILILTLVIVLVLSQLSLASAVGVDYAGHWAQPVIEKWYDYGIVKGYSDGSFKPDNVVTRAEFVTMLNSLFGFVEEEAIAFDDVSEDDWYYHNIRKGATAGIIKGANNMFRPQDKISRQEAAVVLTRAFMLNSDNEYAYTMFNDRGMISDWAISSVNALVESDYIKGRGDNELAPLANLTRAEAITLISNIAGDIIQKPETVTGIYGGNLLVNTADVTLKDSTIYGSLYLTQGIGEGDVVLDNVTVEGELVVLGGGENSIKINNSNIEGKVVVLKIDGKVRIVAEGDTILDEVKMMSGGKLEGKFGNVEVQEIGPGDELVLEGDFEEVSIETEIGNITVEDGSVGTMVLAEGAGTVDVTVAETGAVGTLNVDASESVTLNGEFGEVNVNGQVEELTLESGSIESMTVEETAGGTEVNLGEEVVVETLVLDAPVEVKGEGTVEAAEVNAEGSSFEEAPEDLSGSADTITVGNGDESEEQDVPSSAGGGGFGGGTSGGGTVAPSTVDVTVAMTSDSGLNETLTLEVSADADGYEISQEFMTFVVNNFDTFYDDVEGTLLGNEGMLLIDALSFFEYAEDEDLSGTIFDSLPVKAGAEYTDAEKKAMLKELLTVIADNITDGDLVRDDLTAVAERVDFSKIEYNGYNFKSLELLKDGTRLDKYEQGSDKAAFINAVMEPLTDIDASTTVEYEMIIILDDGNDTTRTSTFETL